MRLYGYYLISLCDAKCYVPFAIHVDCKLARSDSESGWCSTMDYSLQAIWWVQRFVWSAHQPVLEFLSDALSCWIALRPKRL